MAYDQYGRYHYEPVSSGYRLETGTGGEQPRVAPAPGAGLLLAVPVAIVCAPIVFAMWWRLRNWRKARTSWVFDEEGYAVEKQVPSYWEAYWDQDNIGWMTAGMAMMTLILASSMFWVVPLFHFLFL